MSTSFTQKILLAFPKDVGFVLSESSDYYSDALVLSKAANILRRQMLVNKSIFDGNFHKGCIEQTIPLTLFQYDRVLEMSAQLGDATVSKYVEDGDVCPPVLRKRLFITSAMDNIDHDPTAMTATASSHGTSVFQHLGYRLKDLKSESVYSKV